MIMASCRESLLIARDKDQAVELGDVWPMMKCDVMKVNKESINSVRGWAGALLRKGGLKEKRVRVKRIDLRV